MKTFPGTFTGAAFANGEEAMGNPCFDSSGNVYGVCNSGGLVTTGQSFGGGVVWKLTPSNTFSVETSFNVNTASGGRQPMAAAFGGNGNLYGMCSNALPDTSFGGLEGVVWQLTPGGVRTQVHAFPVPGFSAAVPIGPVLSGPDGSLYGSTMRGGSALKGSVWKVDPAGNFSSILSLTDADLPSGLCVGTDGTVCIMGRGNTSGVTDILLHKYSGGTWTTSKPFNPVTHGDRGVAMTGSTDGNFYAVLRRASDNTYRFVRLSPAGAVTLLQTLPADGAGGHDDGNSSLTQGVDGNFYSHTRNHPSRPVIITLSGGYTMLDIPATNARCVGFAPGPGGFAYGTYMASSSTSGVFRFPITVPGPEIALEQPAGTDLADGSGSIDFGTVNTGSSSAAKTFTVKNTGSGALTVTGIATSGGNAAEFTVSSPALQLNVAPAGSATFTVTFSPTAAGARTTTLQLLSNDADEATFDITLTGTGNVPVDADTDGLPDAWELLHFGAAGTTAGADDDGDGMNNFGEYAFGLNPNSGDLSPLPQATQTGGLMTLTVTKQPHVAYTIVASTELSAGSFSTAGLTIVTDDETTLTVRETAAGTRRFMQVRAVPAP